MLDILQGFLHTRGYNCHRLDGSTDRHTREQIISNFGEKKINVAPVDEEEACPVFLLSTRAGVP